MKIWQLIITGVFVHIVLFYSIFDIYFTSPLVHGMRPITPSASTSTGARRLVLFVADGLRADKFFEFDDTQGTPFLREIITHHGAWGVSHTRVPTESRPGHVALIAGFYEDVSAVAKGWKENPVEFDSVFNESRYTWSWGSPDILPMFAKGASGDHVAINCYPSELEDFAASNMTLLDTWVFKEVKAFFESASTNSTLRKMLQEDRLVFFLHLLGIDTHGHSKKPHSREYLDNIKVVDQGIREIVNLVEEFYGHDKKTAYIMTADHGMTDWGSHGAGHAQETLTPFVAWGCGIRRPVIGQHCGVDTDTFCTDWHLEAVKRCDMEQADVAPLMSYLVGIPFPLNSVGVLPVDVLDATDGQKAEALLANAEQILEQFQVKMDQVKHRTISVTFRPFPELIEAEKLQAVRQVRHLIHNGLFKEAMKETHILMQKALHGLRYYQTYDRFFLGVSIVLAFLGWKSYILCLVVSEHTGLGKSGTRAGEKSSTSGTGNYVFVAVGLCTAVLLYVQSLPLMCYVYCLLPVILWWKSYQGWSLLYPALRSATASLRVWSALGLSLLFCLLGLEISILSFYQRELLSLGLLAMAAQPFVSCGSQTGGRISTVTSLGWCGACVLLAVFPLLPVVGRETQYYLVYTSGSIAVITGAVITRRLFSSSSRGSTKYLWLIQLSLVSWSVLTVYMTATSIEGKTGLPTLCQVSSWLVLGVCCVLPLFSSTTLMERLFSLSLAFLAPYLLLSITYEGFFFLSLLSLLYFWLRMEHEVSGRTKQGFAQIDFQREGLVKDSITSPTFSRHLELADLRRAFIFIFLNLTAFFGTGNIASINSFDPASVYCFLTVFNPFLMGSLMMLKNMIPFLLVTCAFRGIHVLTRTPLRSLFLIVLIMSDFMGLHFFFLVRDSGSWLEIGTTISHYVIVMVMIIFLLLLTGLSHVLTCCRIPVFSRPKHSD